MMVGKSKKQASINGEMFHIYCSSGWKILNFLKEVESNRAIFHKKEWWKSLLLRNHKNKTAKMRVKEGLEGGGGYKC